MTKIKRMDTLFECEYTLDKKRFLSWGRENNANAPVWGFMVFWCIFAALFFAYAIYTKFYFLLVFCFFSLYRGLFRRRLLTARQYAVLSKRHGTESWTRKVSFSESGIVTSDGNVTVNNLYSELRRIEEKNGYIKLYLKHNTVIRLYSDCFTTGTWDECRKYIAGMSEYLRD